MHNIIETFQKILGIKLEFEYVGRESEGGGILDWSWSANFFSFTKIYSGTF